MSQLTIGKLSKATGVSIDTIRYYERERIIPPARRTASNYRVFDDDTVQALRFVRRAKDLGFTLDAIRELLSLSHGGDRGDVRDLAARHVQAIDQRLRDLQVMRDTLASAVERCDGEGSIAGCPIMDAIGQRKPAHQSAG